MKNKLLFGAIVMLFIAMFSSSALSAEWDNTKSYDLETKTATIHNLLGLGGDIAEITLLDNTDLCLMNCEANIKLDLKTDYNKPLKQIRFFKVIENTFNEKNIEHQILIRTTNYTIKKDDWINTCENLKQEDGTYEDVCSSEISGYHEETEWNYEPLDKSKELKEGIHYIKLKGIKNPHDTIEWIPNFAGLEINEWATWGSGLDTGIIAYYDFNGSANDTYGRYNGTLAGTIGLPEFKSSCKINGCYQYQQGYGHFINLTDKVNLTNQGNNFTIMFWINNTRSDGGALGVPISQDYVWGWEFYGNNLAGTAAGTHMVFHAGSSKLKSGYDIGGANANQWHQVIVTRNFTNGTVIWVDGIERANAVQQDAYRFKNWLVVGARVAYITNVTSEYYSPATYGKIDDFALWNRTLSASEISDLWNGGAGLENTYVGSPPDTEPIMINITTFPANFTYHSLGLKINATVTLNTTTNYRINVSFIWYQGTTINISNNTGKHSIPNATNVLMTGNGNAIRFPYNLTTYQLGYNYTAGVYACYGALCGQYNSSNVTITSSIGTWNPIFYPASVINTTTSVNGSMIYNGLSAGNIEFSWWNNNGLLRKLVFNSITAGTSLSDILNATNYTHYDNITLTVNGTSGAETYRINSSFFVWNSPPSIPTQIYPLNDSTFIISTRTLMCNGSTDIDGDTVYYQFYNDTKLMQNSTSTTFNWNTPANGTYYWRCAATDLNASSDNTTLWQYYYNKILIGLNGTGYPILNLTFWREMLPTENLTGKVDMVFNIWVNNDPSENTTLNLSSYNVSWASVYVGVFPNSTIFTADAMLEYVSDTYDKRQYYYYHANFSNATQQLSLYLLEITYGRETRITVEDEVGNPINDAYIKIQRYYVGEDLYRTVAMGHTDALGQDTVFLREADAWYRFIVERNGVVIYIDSQPRKITKDSGSVVANIIITIVPDTIKETLDKYGSIYYNLSFNNVTNNVVLVFSDTSGLTSENCLYLKRFNAKNQTLICDSCVTTASGTIICNIGAATNDTYVATYYAAGSPQKIIDTISFVLTNLKKLIYGAEGIFAAIFITGTAAVIGALIGGSIGAILLGILSLLAGTLIGLITISWTVFMGIIIIAVVIIAKLKER